MNTPIPGRSQELREPTFPRDPSPEESLKMPRCARNEPPRQDGFNLLEMLIAMTVLVAVVSLACMILSHSDEAWFRGTERAVNLSDGRNALALITRDLEQAVADTYLSFRIQPDRLRCASYGFTNDEVCLVSLPHEPDGASRTVREVMYWVAPAPSPEDGFRLIRSSHTVAATHAAQGDNCYWNFYWHCDPPLGGAGRPPPSEQGPVAEHVAAFALVLPDGRSDYDSGDQANRLPEYVDVLLALLDARAARQAAGMDPASQRRFVERHARRYTTRIYFRNRIGYMAP